MKKRTILIGIGILALTIIGIVLISGCVEEKPKEEFFASYNYGAECAYEKIEVNQSKLIYTYFEDVNDKCAICTHQVPCWKEEDLKTKEVTLSEEEIDDLIDVINQTNYMDIENSYGYVDGARCYSESLFVKIKEKEKKVIYFTCASGGIYSMPDVFKKVKDKLFEIVDKKFNIKKHKPNNCSAITNNFAGCNISCSTDSDCILTCCGCINKNENCQTELEDGGMIQSINCMLVAGECKCINGRCEFFEEKPDKIFPIESNKNNQSNTTEINTSGDESNVRSKLSYNVSECEHVTFESMGKKIDVSIENKTVRIHQDLPYVCCANITVELKEKNNTLQIIENNIGGICKCMCMYYVEAEIANLKPGKYELEIYGVKEENVPNQFENYNKIYEGEIEISEKSLKNQSKIGTQGQALKIARKTEEAHEFLKLYPYAGISISKEPENTTWIVDFGYSGAICKIIIDKNTGKIIEKSPKIEYLKSAGYCERDVDCMIPYSEHSDWFEYGETCLNFIHLPKYDGITIMSNKKEKLPDCKCINNTCVTIYL